MPTADEVNEQVAEANANPNGRPPDRLSEVREQARKIARDKSITLQVPGYGGLVGVRYHGITSSELDGFIGRAQTAAEAGKVMQVNADLLIRCCGAILVRNRAGAEWEAFDLEADEPTTFSTGTLPALMPETIGHATTAREEVFGLFSPDDSQAMAVGLHAEALITWLQGSTEQIDRTLLGE